LGWRAIVAADGDLRQKKTTSEVKEFR
jgi:hypothetical protein